jgi:hypothetical protein
MWLIETSSEPPGHSLMAFAHPTLAVIRRCILWLDKQGLASWRITFEFTDGNGGIVIYEVYL